jgi:ubiquinone/menaquinone biosynthesis C-methylase UbiE
VLDLGCGSGVPSTRRLAPHFLVTGVDGSAAQIAAARRNVPEATFMHGDVVDLELHAASYDAVTMLYALSHLPRTEHAAVLGRIHRWLRPNGLLLRVS